MKNGAVPARWRSWGAAVGWSLLWLAGAAALVLQIHPRSPGELVGGWRALAEGVLAGADTLSHDYPAAWWGWRELIAGGAIPLWNPSWFGGQPFVASLTFLPYYPFNWLMGLLPLPLAFNVQYPLHLMMATGVMAWTCRRRGMSWSAAGIAAVAWGFGGHLATLAGPGHLQKLQALTWLPLVVFGLGQLGTRRGARRATVPLAVGLALQLLTGQAQVIYMSILAGAAESAVRLLRAARRASRCQGARHGLEALAMALLLSGILWVPFAEFAGASNRQAALTWTDAVRGSLPPEESAEIVLPRLRGDTVTGGRGAYVGRFGESPTSRSERVVSDYAGAGVLVLELVALALPGRRAAAGWLALAAGGLLLAIGGYWGEGYRLLLDWIPGLDRFRAPSVFLALTSFGLAMAAAEGVRALERVRRLPGTIRRRRAIALIVGALVLLVALITSAAIMAAAGDGAAWQRLARRPADAAEAIRALRAVALLHVAVFGGAALALVALLGLLLRARDGRRLAHLVFGALALTLTVDLTTNARAFWTAAAHAPFERYMQSHWAMDRIQSDAERLQGPLRILEAGNELRNWALTWTDFAGGRVVSSVHGYHPLAYGDYFRLLGGLGFTDPAFLRLFDVRMIAWPEEQPIDPAIEAAGFREHARQPGQILLWREEARFVRPAGRIVEVADWDAMLQWLRHPANDPTSATVVLADDALRDTPATDAGRAMRRLDYRAYPLGPGEWRIEYAADAPGEVVVSLPADPGWRVRVRDAEDADGAWRPVPVRRAFGYFMLPGPLPPRGELALIYDPVSQRLGLHLTLLGLGWIGFLLGKGRRI